MSAVIKSRFTELLRVEVPVMQAPIGSCSCPELAAAVSNAGGLGMLALSWHTLDGCGEKTRRTRQLTKAPFGINLVLKWNQTERLRASLDAGAEIVSLFWGDPESYLPIIRSAGARAIIQVGSSDEAKRAADLGADAILCQGFEAGGHVRGNIGSVALVPIVVDAVSPLPVIAAGGFGDGRGLAAALALGASAISMGTRFLATEESLAHPQYKQRIVDASPEDTLYTDLFDGGWEEAAHRVLRNSTISEWELAGRPMRGARPREADIVACLPGGREIHSYADTPPLRDMSGEWERCAMYAGESVGVIHDIPSAGEVVRRIVSEATIAIRRLNENILGRQNDLV